MKFTGKNLHQSLFFNKVVGLRPATLLNKRLWCRCFPVNFCKIFKSTFFVEYFWWLLLHFISYRWIYIPILVISVLLHNLIHIQSMGQLTVSAPLSHFLLGGQPTVLNFEKGEPEKNECPGDLKESPPQIFAWGGLPCFLSKKTL